MLRKSQICWKHFKMSIFASTMLMEFFTYFSNTVVFLTALTWFPRKNTLFPTMNAIWVKPCFSSHVSQYQSLKMDFKRKDFWIEEQDVQYVALDLMDANQITSCRTWNNPRTANWPILVSPSISFAPHDLGPANNVAT